MFTPGTEKTTESTDYRKSDGVMWRNGDSDRLRSTTVFSDPTQRVIPTH
jgi:hypothetical protein